VSDLEIEVLGAADSVSAREMRELCELVLTSVGITDGHLAVEFVNENRIRELNRAHRDHDEPTDVLSFGVDENQPLNGPRELGDIVICPDHTADIREAVIHGALHVAGMDHETDGGEMLALQKELLRARAK
jgi:probable rRNA maturation factor